MTRIRVLLLAMLAMTACASAPLGSASSTTSSTSGTEPTDALPSDTQPADALPAPADDPEPLRSFEMRLSLRGTFDGEDIDATDFVVARFDLVNEQVYSVFDYRPLQAVNEFEPIVVEIAETSAGDFVRGATADFLGLSHDLEVDSDTWLRMEGGPNQQIFNVLPPTGNAAEVASLFGQPAPDRGGRSTFKIDADLWRSIADAHPDSVAGLLSSPNGAVVVEMETNSSGRLVRFLATDSSPIDDLATDLELTFGRFDESFEFPDLSVSEPLPTAPTSSTTDVLDESRDLPDPTAEVVFRFWTYLGPEPAGQPGGDFNVSLQPDGTVVLVDGTSVLDGAESYTTWQLTPGGMERLIREITANQLVASGQRIGANDRAYALTMSGVSGFGAHPSDGPVDAEVQAALDQLADRLRDQSWLRDRVISGPEPWIPDHVTMVARRADGARTEVSVWPLDRSIRALGTPGEADDIVLCLEGDDAAAAWTLVRDGVNHAHIAVDDGEPWTISYSIAFPGYRLYGDPCWS